MLLTINPSQATALSLQTHKPSRSVSVWWLGSFTVDGIPSFQGEREMASQVHKAWRQMDGGTRVELTNF